MTATTDCYPHLGSRLSAFGPLRGKSTDEESRPCLHKNNAKPTFATPSSVPAPRPRRAKQPPPITPSATASSPPDLTLLDDPETAAEIEAKPRLFPVRHPPRTRPDRRDRPPRSPQTPDRPRRNRPPQRRPLQAPRIGHFPGHRRHPLRPLRHLARRTRPPRGIATMHLGAAWNQVAQTIDRMSRHEGRLSTQIDGKRRLLADLIASRPPAPAPQEPAPAPPKGPQKQLYKTNPISTHPQSLQRRRPRLQPKSSPPAPSPISRMRTAPSTRSRASRLHPGIRIVHWLSAGAGKQAGSVTTPGHVTIYRYWPGASLTPFSSTSVTQSACEPAQPKDEVGATRALRKASPKAPMGLVARRRSGHVCAIPRACHLRGCRRHGGCRHRGSARSGPAQDRGAAERDFQQR